MRAAKGGHRDIVQYLCENGANVNANNGVSDNRTVMYVCMYIISMYIHILYTL